MLHASQSIIAKDKHRFRVLVAGRRFGKSYLCGWEMYAMALSRKDARIAYIATTYQQAKDIVWNELKNITAPTIIKVQETSPLTCIVRNKYGGESFITLRGWENIDTLRGQKFDLIVLDEVASMRNFQTHWQEVIRPTLTDRKGEALFIGTPKGFNHLYDLFQEENNNEDWKSFHYTSYDNPYLDPTELDMAKKDMTEDRFAQEYLAEFKKMEGLVYKEFSRNIHVTDELPVFVSETLAGVDFGFTHPAAVVSISIDNKGVYWILNDYLKSGNTEDEICDYVATQQFNLVFPDPENASAIESLRRRGVNIREVNKGKYSVVSGINKVRELLKSNRIKVHKSCIHVIQAFEMYAYPEEKNGQTNEIPSHEYSDILDALRYCIFMHSGSSIRRDYRPTNNMNAMR